MEDVTVEGAGAPIGRLNNRKVYKNMKELRTSYLSSLLCSELPKGAPLPHPLPRPLPGVKVSILI